MLHHRTDFVDLLVTVGESTGAGAALVEKDYWVTEALRVIATSFFEGVVFKGGTSLSKAWNLIHRFSEDIDLLVRSEGEGLDTGGARDRYMKAVEKAVSQVDGLTLLPDDGRSERGISRASVFGYEPRAPAREGLATRIILEMGIRGGPHPAEMRQIQSMLGAALTGTAVEDESTQPFEMFALDPRRTFVEKLFAINSACELWEEGRTTALQRQSRHFSDIHALLGDPRVAEFVGSEDYLSLITEIDEVGRTYFPRDHRTPDGLRFVGSRALTPDGDLLTAIEEEYARSEFLFYGARPDLAEILSRVENVRDRL